MSTSDRTATTTSVRRRPELVEVVRRETGKPARDVTLDAGLAVELRAGS